MKLSSGICCCRGAVLTGLTCLFSKKKKPRRRQTNKRWGKRGEGGGGWGRRDYNDYSCFCGRNKKRKTTGCYVGLAFMKKDIEVNDCETPIPPTTTTTPKKRERKIETSAELSKLLFRAPVFLQNILLKVFFMKEENKEKKMKICFVCPYWERKKVLSAFKIIVWVLKRGGKKWRKGKYM